VTGLETEDGPRTRAHACVSNPVSSPGAILIIRACYRSATAWSCAAFRVRLRFVRSCIITLFA